jgi:hypothetical protein
MNVDREKERQPLGQALIELDHVDRMVLRRKLIRIGLTQAKWKHILTNAVAYELPSFVRDAIVESVPSTAELFEHPNLKTEPVS